MKEEILARLFYSYVMDLLDGTKIETSFLFVLFLVLYKRIGILSKFNQKSLVAIQGS